MDTIGLIMLFQIPSIDWATLLPWIIGLATPFVVKLATDLAIKTLPTLTAWKILVFVVPVLGGIATGISNILTTMTPAWYLQLALALLAVLVNELQKAYGEAKEAKAALGKPLGVGQKRLQQP
jgi:hypothetical protein